MNDDYWMKAALALARKAGMEGEVPVGAIVVLEGEIIGKGWNQPISSCDPTAHAEVVALREAARKVGNYRLVNAELFVTLEPCSMCAGAIVHSRIKRLVYGAHEPKAGVVKSQQHFFEQSYLNHRPEIVSGICSEESSEILQNFFRERRSEKADQKNSDES